MRMPRLVLVVVCAVGLARPAFAQSPDRGVDDPAPLTAAALQRPSSVPDFGVGTVPDASASAPKPPATGFFSGLFGPLGGDFKHLASRDTALWLAVGAGAALAAHPSDKHFSTTLSTSDGVEDALDPGTPIGSGYIQVGAAFGAYVIGRVAGKSELAHVGGDLFRAQLIDTAMVQGVKLAAGRTRPDGAKYSFPSGHTSSAFTTAAVLQRHYGWKVGLPAYSVAAYVGGSRIAENRHYLSDVLFGAALGIIAGHAVTVGHGSRQFALAPIAVPGGAGIGFVHIGQ